MYQTVCTGPGHFGPGGKLVADRMVSVARRLGKTVYHDIGEVP